MKFKILFVMLAVLLGVASCSSQSNNQINNKKKMNAIVVFFSHAGENYNVGNIKVGNTKIVADYITELVGAEQFEIVADKNYNMPYMQLIEVAKQETNNNEYPTYKGSVDLSKYDTVFVGGPIWWGTYPQVMFSFFHNNDLNSKTIVPFTTHEGSGLGSVVSDLKKLYPNANFAKSFSIQGREVRGGKAKVEKWINSL